ncbi:hypothetical protein ACFL2Q_00250 [Thermodesulfobacteriota bacterium]
MPEPKYRVKFYGHTAPDEVVFCKNLAAILQTTPEDAVGLLRNCPVVVSDNIDKSKADKMAALITSMRGLCLSEPVEESTVEEQVQSLSSAQRVARMEKEAAGHKEDLRYRIWGSIVILVTAGFLIFTVVAYVITFSNVHKVAPPPDEPITKIESEKSSKEPADLEQTARDLRDEIQDLKQELQDLRTSYGYAKDGARGALEAYGSKSEEYKEKKIEMFSIEKRFKATQKLIQRREKLLRNLGGWSADE